MQDELVFRGLPTDRGAAIEYLRNHILLKYGSVVSNPKTQGVFRSPNLVGFISIYDEHSKRDLISLAETNNFLGVINEEGEFERLNKHAITRYSLWSIDKMCQPTIWTNQMRALFRDLSDGG